MENRAYKVIFQQDEREKISYVYSVILLAFTEINYMNDFIPPLLFHRYHVLCYACSLIQVSNLLISVTHHFSVEKKKKNHIISSKLQTFFFQLYSAQFTSGSFVYISWIDCTEQSTKLSFQISKAFYK